MSEPITLNAVTLDCPSAPDLAGFYAEILDGTLVVLDEGWAAVVTPHGRLHFQSVVDYVPPSWPDPGAPGRLHLDLLVSDRAATEAAVVAAGATRYPDQPNDDHCTVFADPAGHPFCLSTWADPAAEVALLREKG